MIRLVVLCVLSASVAMPVAAQSKKDRFCNDLGAASQKIAELRIDGSSETDAQLAMIEYFGEDQVTHLQMVPYLSSFVYGLSDADLKDDVGAAFADQCKAFKG
ncbi:hypothetical protein [Planktotalea sp.]|uniref:hypothetical protein n=1 Tax=Planktotalea sp. TaxID=2029877 RepID=UPI0032980841